MIKKYNSSNEIENIIENIIEKNKIKYLKEKDNNLNLIKYQFNNISIIIFKGFKFLKIELEINFNKSIQNKLDNNIEIENKLLKFILLINNFDCKNLYIYDQTYKMIISNKYEFNKKDKNINKVLLDLKELIEEDLIYLNQIYNNINNIINL